MKNLIIILMLAFVINANAQNETEIDTFFYAVTVESSENESFTGFFNYFYYNDYPTVGDKFEIYALYSSEISDINKLQGIGVASNILEGRVYWDFNFNKSADVDIITNSGKAITKIAVKIPKTTQKDLIYSMLKNSIYMQDVFDKDIFYEMNYINSDLLEDDILTDILDDVMFTAQAMKEDMEAPITAEGRFAGIDLFTAMENSTIDDIRSFMRYAEAFPTKYRGRVWKASEIYATWVNANSPCTFNDIAEILYKNIENKENFNRYLKDIEGDVYIQVSEEVRNTAQEFIDKKEFEEAEKYVRISEKIGEKYNSNEVKGWTHSSFATIYSEKEEYNKAVKEYEAAIKKFTKPENKAGLFLSYNNISKTLNLTKKKSDYKKAVKYSQKAIEILEPLSKMQEIRNIIALSFKNYGNALTGLKKYKKAIEIYNEGLKYVEAETVMSLKRRAVLYMQLSELYKLTKDKKNEEKYTNLMVETYRKYENK